MTTHLIHDRFLGRPVGFRTVDATRDREEYLVNAQKQPGGGNTHQSIETIATSFIDSGDTRGILNIIGHGDKGIIIAGAGEKRGKTNQSISLDNKELWKAAFHSLQASKLQASRLHLVRLWGCHVGAGWQGVELVADLADYLDAQVEAPTGTVYCHSADDGLDCIYCLQAGGVWQVAVPGKKPDPISVARGHRPKFPLTLHVRNAGGFGQVYSDEVASVALYAEADQEHPVVRLEGFRISALIGLFGFDEPFTPPGPPGALVSAILVVTFTNAAAERLGGAKRRFEILNNVLARDTAFPNTYYHTACEELEEYLHLTPTTPSAPVAPPAPKATLRGTEIFLPKETFPHTWRKRAAERRLRRLKARLLIGLIERRSEAGVNEEPPANLS